MADAHNKQQGKPWRGGRIQLSELPDYHIQNVRALRKKNGDLRDQHNKEYSLYKKYSNWPVSNKKLLGMQIRKYGLGLPWWSSG